MHQQQSWGPGAYQQTQPTQQPTGWSAGGGASSGGSQQQNQWNQPQQQSYSKQQSYASNKQGAYPSNKQGAYPSNKQGAYPSNKQAYPSNKQAYPSNKQAYPSNKQAYPSNKQAYPSNKQAYTSNKPAYPSNKPAYPSNKQAYPSNNTYNYNRQQQSSYQEPHSKMNNFVSGGYNSNAGGARKPNTGTSNWANQQKPAWPKAGFNAGWNQKNSWQRRPKIKKPPREKKIYECELCKVRCDTPDQLNIHQSSKKHMKRVKAAEAEKNKPPGDPKKPTTTTTTKSSGAQKRQKFHCELCGVWCDTQVILDIHLKSKKHEKKANKIPGVSVFNRFKCALCNVSPSSQAAYDSHMASKKHQRNVYQHEAAQKKDEPEKKPAPTNKAAPAKKAYPEPRMVAVDLSGGTAKVVETMAVDSCEGEDKQESTEATTKKTDNAEPYIEPGKDEEMKCEMCRAVCENQAAYDYHIATNRHKKRVMAMTMEFKCEVCCVGTNTQLMLDNHMQSKKHKQHAERASSQKYTVMKDPNRPKKEGKVKRRKKEWRKKKKARLEGAEEIEVEAEAEAADGSGSGENKENCPFVCELCDVRCNSQDVLDKHLTSKRHFRKLKFTDAQKKKLFCPKCEYQATSNTDFDDHLRTQEHANNAGLNLDSSTGKRKGDFGVEPRKKAKLEAAWRVCRLCGSEAHNFRTCAIKENRGWEINQILRNQLKKCTTIANDRHRDLVVLFTVKDKNDERLVSHFICCTPDVQRKMLHQSMKLMNDMLKFVPQTRWYEIDYRFGNWLHKPKKSSPHLHILFPEEQYMEFLRAQPNDSPIWPQGIANFEEYSLTDPVQKNYDLDRVYATKKQAWYNNFTIIDNLLIESKCGLEILLKNGVCDGSVGLRVGRPVNVGQEHYQFFVRVSAEPFVSMSEECKKTVENGMEEAGFEVFTGEKWNESARGIHGDATFSV